MYLTSPVVPSRKDQEFSWAHGLIMALPVNLEEKAGTVVLRYKLTWLERLTVLLRGNLWVWISTYDEVPQWPALRVHAPVDIGTKVLPDALDLFQKRRKRDAEHGVLVPNPQPDGTMSERMAPNLERELRMTLPEKIAERERMNQAFRQMDEEAHAKLEETK